MSDEASRAAVEAAGEELFEEAAPETSEAEHATMSASDLRDEARRRNLASAAMLGRLSQPNAFFSPWSLQSALAMLAEGSGAETREELLALLQQDSDDPNSLLAGLARSIMHKNEGEDAPIIRIAQDIWLQDGWPAKEDYLAALERHFDSGVHAAPFTADSEAARAAINERVSEQTESLIPELMPEGSVHEDTRFVLTSAIYFKGLWADPFEESSTGEAEFNLADGETVTVDFMARSTMADVFRSQALQMFSLPYRGYTTEILFVLPADLDAFLSAPDLAETLEDATSSMERNLLVVSLPRFQLSHAFNATELVQSLGADAMFSPSEADFSGITEEDGLFVDIIQHEAFIRVDEQGTEAAAATGIGVRTTSIMVPEQPIILDRPFAYFIRDIETGLILFAGRMDDPSLAPVED